MHVIAFLAAALVVMLLVWPALRIRRQFRYGLLVASVIAFFALAGFNWLACRGLSLALGGSALLGGVNADGNYYLAIHSVVTPVDAATYWRLYYYERGSGVVMEIAFWSFTIMWVVVAIAQHRGFLARTDDAAGGDCESDDVPPT